MSRSMAAEGAWESLSVPWQTAFEQAWESFRDGNFGIGAALADAGGDVVAVGRNLVSSDRPAAQPLAGNYMAHAEMNAYAALTSFTAEGLRLHTTLEPCLMCSATGIFMNLKYVEYAARDEFYESFDEQLWPRHPYTQARQPDSRQTLTGPLSAFARLMPLAFTLRWKPDGNAARVARRARPRLAQLTESDDFAALEAAAASGATVADGLALVWPLLDGADHVSA